MPSDNKWSMNGVEIDTLEDLFFPYLGQPKLDGVRAKWDGKNLTSRQGKVWSPNQLPHVYEHLTRFSHDYPNVILDGELYCHGMPFQEICKRVALNRNNPHDDSASVEFHAFDIISTDLTEERQIALSQIYKPWVSVCKVENKQNMEVWTNRFHEAGFEGLMMRVYKCPYLPGRTEALIKVKPWMHGFGIVEGFIEGEGKYKGILGAIRFKLDETRTFFNASGGLSDEQRDFIWKNKEAFRGIRAAIKYRALSNAGIPLRPQIVKI